MSQSPLSRRIFLTSAAAALPAAGVFLLGCKNAIACPDPPSEAPAPAPAKCEYAVPTATNIEGPYYRPYAPFRADLVDPGVVGAPLLLSGAVRSLDCNSPLAAAVIDVWQANGEGHYDNDGTLKLPEGAMRLRGKLRTDSKGGYSARSVLPGRYLNGNRFRPAHIHVKVSAPGHITLTTQLYFPDDPFNEGDPFINRSLIMAMSKVRGDAAAHFDFVLTPRK